MRNNKTHFSVFEEMYGKNLITFSKYSKILNEINKGLLDLLVEGKKIRIGKNIGQIKIVSRPRANYNSIDWGASKKLKQQIIDSGEIPKDKENPDGKDWLVYFVDDRYLQFEWVKYKHIDGLSFRHLGVTNYKFTPVFHARRRLSAVKNNNLIEMTYEHKNYK